MSTPTRTTDTLGEDARPEADRPAVEPDPRRSRPIPGWLLLSVAALALAVAAAAVALGALRPSDRGVAEGTDAARAAAERAIVPILSYDAADLEGSRAAARSYLTGSYREDYDRLFAGVIEENAPETGIVLEADVLRSGVVRGGADRVQVFLLIDQRRTSKADPEPVVYRNWVTVTMERVDGDWLVADLHT